jgi:pilus assembly protein FimV
VLEIHAQHNKPSAFETVASELYTVSGGKGEVWQKAMALGRQLDPNNPLFSEAAGAAAFAAAAASGEHHAAPRDEGAAPAHAAAPAEVRPPEPRVTKPVDLALDEDISISPTSLAVPPPATPKTPASILAGAAQEVAKSTRATETRPVPGVTFGPESVPKFDLDFNLDEPSKPGPPMAPAPRPVAKAPLADAGTPAPQLARPAAAIELDKLDLAFDPERSTFEDPTPSVLDGQWHDAATKLDLAKAYQEMGDVEGAREILQEVLHEGDDAQKAEAESLLSKLA